MKGNFVLQRILGVVLVLAGLVGAALGVASATVWRQTDTVAATARPTGDGTLVVTDPGVLGLVNGDVTITATVPKDQQVTLAIGREVDVLGWVGDDPYTRVTGLTDWETLRVAAGSAGEGQEKPAAGPNPAGSDMWLAEASDTGRATLRYSDTPGRWVLLAAGVGEGAQAPTVELTWPRTVATPYLWPAVGGGALLVVLGLVVLLAARRRSRADQGDEPAGPRKGRRDGGPEDPRSGAPVDPDRSEGSALSPTTWEPAAAPAAAQDDAAANRGPFAPVNVRDDGDGGPARDERTSTAPVPVAGRFSRLSRAVRDLPTRDPGGQTRPVPGDSPSGAPRVDTGSHSAVARDASGDGRLTRRELRLQEEARRAAEQSGGGGVGRRLRALTGSIPAVRSQPSQPPAEEPAEADPATPAGRAAAWRQAWGFDPAASQDDATRRNDPNDRGDR